MSRQAATEQVLATFRAADPGKRIPPGLRPDDKLTARSEPTVIRPHPPRGARNFRALLSAAVVAACIAGLAVFLAVGRGRPEAGGPPPAPTASHRENGNSRKSAQQLVRQVIAAVPQPPDRVLVEAPGTGKIAHPSEGWPRRNIAHASVFAVSPRAARQVIHYFDRAVPAAPIAGLRFDANSSSGTSDGVFGSDYSAPTRSPETVHLVVTAARSTHGSSYRIDAWMRWANIPQSKGRSR